nr:uncharacterized protein LOC128706124 [Cherax quadricarinatus]
MCLAYSSLMNPVAYMLQRPKSRPPFTHSTGSAGGNSLYPEVAAPGVGPITLLAFTCGTSSARGEPLHPGDGSIVDATSQKNCPMIYDTVGQIRKLYNHLQRRKMHKISRHSQEA